VEFLFPAEKAVHQKRSRRGSIFRDTNDSIACETIVPATIHPSELAD
jgi:hypothetical protein